jgi:hypothetical protein
METGDHTSDRVVSVMAIFRPLTSRDAANSPLFIDLYHFQS